MLALAGWTPELPLLDPMCGSGTVAIEAAAIGAGLAPGLGREFAFVHLGRYDARRWQALCDGARNRREGVEPLRIYASDKDGRAVERARANARAAGVGGIVRLRTVDVLDLSPPAEAGVIVTNPPYGVRLDEASALAAFYPRFGDVLKQRFAGWTAWVLTADRELARRIGLRPTRRIPLYNGALECRLYGFRLVRGTLRGGVRPEAGGETRGSGAGAPGGVG
jgi:putative N6-adenine-specific DNA methylase